MKLSNLIAYKRSVDEFDADLLQQQVTKSLDILNNKVQSFDCGEDYADIIEAKQKILDDLKELDQTLASYKRKISHQIEHNETAYLRQSYDIYTGMHNDTADYILARENTLTVDNTKDFCDRIKLYSSWKHAGLYIRPGKNHYVDQMISSDPLYIADEHLELLEPVKQMWNKEYQDRVRYKIISDDSDRVFRDIPTNQLGLIVATNFFNYKPFEVIKKYLLEFQTLLKPGGVVIFTYNNCDVPEAIRNVENMFNCYTPGRLLKDFIVSLDYELLYSVESSSGLNWLEIKKPGTQTSLRGGQSLAKIITNTADKI